MAESESADYVALEDLPDDYQWKQCDGSKCDKGAICRGGCENKICPKCEGSGWLCVGEKVDTSHMEISDE